MPKTHRDLAGQGDASRVSEQLAQHVAPDRAFVIGWINSMTHYALIAVNQQRALTRAFVIGLVFNIVANRILIPTYSYVGVADACPVAERARDSAAAGEAMELTRVCFGAA